MYSIMSSLSHYLSPNSSLCFFLLPRSGYRDDVGERSGGSHRLPYPLEPVARPFPLISCFD